MRINFLNEYYKSRSIDQNQSDLVNMYLEIEAPDANQTYNQTGVSFQSGKFKCIGIQSPGKTVFNSGSGSVVRGMIEHRGVAYAVVDNKFYSYDSAGTRTERGTLSTSTGVVELAAISTAINMVDGTSQYNYIISSATFSTVNDADAPLTPITLTSQDETFLASSSNSIVVNGSDVSSGTSWAALSFGSKSTYGDYIQRLIAFKSRVWVIGVYNSEVWYNSGAATFSFELVQGSVSPYGTPAKNSVAKGTSALYMIGQSKMGGLCIVSMNDAGIKLTPNQGIIHQINQLTTISDAIGYCYEKGGHEFYILNFPTEGVSFEYDITSDVWSSRMSYVGSAYTRDLGNCYMYCYGKQLIGAYNSGTLYYLDSTVYQENGVDMLKRIVTPPAYADSNKLFVDRLQIDMEKDVGSNMTVTLDVSRDSGHSYSDSYTNTIPTSGNSMEFRRLGMTSDAFVFRYSSTANCKFIVLGAFADIRKGIH